MPKDNYFPEWVIHATPEQPDTQDEFFVAMQIQRLGNKAELAAKFSPVESENGRAVRIVCGDRTHLVVFRAPDAKGPLRAAGLETDGEAAAVELTAQGKVVKALAVNATSLRYQESSLFHSDRATNWSTPNAP